MSEKKRENKFEFAVFANDYKIISRYIYVDGYNPKVRNSIDIRNMSESITEQIQESLKWKDIHYMYDKYDLRSNDFMTKWGPEIKSAKKFVEEQNR